jgi:hypothetical protein
MISLEVQTQKITMRTIRLDVCHFTSNIGHHTKMKC